MRPIWWLIGETGRPWTAHLQALWIRALGACVEAVMRAVLLMHLSTTRTLGVSSCGGSTKCACLHALLLPLPCTARLLGTSNCSSKLDSQTSCHAAHRCPALFPGWMQPALAGGHQHTT